MVPIPTLRRAAVPLMLCLAVALSPLTARADTETLGASSVTTLFFATSATSTRTDVSATSDGDTATGVDTISQGDPFQSGFVDIYNFDVSGLGTITHITFNFTIRTTATPDGIQTWYGNRESYYLNVADTTSGGLVSGALDVGPMGVSSPPLDQYLSTDGTTLSFALAPTLFTTTDSRTLSVRELSATITTAAVPLPAGGLLLVSGLAGLALARRKLRRH